MCWLSLDILILLSMYKISMTNSPSASKGNCTPPNRIAPSFMDTLKVLLFPVLQMLPLALRLTPGNGLTEFFNWPPSFIIWKSLRPADARVDQLSPSVCVPHSSCHSPTRMSRSTSAPFWLEIKSSMTSSTPVPADIVDNKICLASGLFCRTNVVPCTCFPLKYVCSQHGISMLCQANPLLHLQEA